MNSVLANTDSYKLSHKGFMESGTQIIYSNLTPRSSKHFNHKIDEPNLKFDDKVVFFGLQYFIKEYLIDHWNNTFFFKPKEQVIGKFKRLVDAYLGPDSVPMEHFEALHDLGYLPICIQALPEGSRVNIKVPVLTIYNTHIDFAWLTNYLETVMSASLWKPMTTATIIYEYRKLINYFADITCGDRSFTMFQAHDFSFRGMSGRHDAAINGAAFLLSSCGTDTIPAIELLEQYYNADVTQEFIATSVPASEHSIQCSGTAIRGEFESFKKWITEDYPTGIVSLVSDGYDYWKVLTEYLPALKPDILARAPNALGLSKVVIRPDSGDPVKIIAGYNILSVRDEEHLYQDPPFLVGVELIHIQSTDKYFTYRVDPACDDFSHDTITLLQEVPRHVAKGSIEVLWEIFGGTVTDKGYKQLDSHIGLIYGDSITLDVAHKVFVLLQNKGFASTNVVFGVGSYTMNYLTRDTFGIAVKATWTKVNGIEYDLYKDPVTDSGMKKSAKGLLRVEKQGNDFILHDQQKWEQIYQGELDVVFDNGNLVTETSLSEIRNRLHPVT